MSEAPIMPFFTDAYLADCHHLSTEAHGAMLLILLHTWRLNGKPLADKDEEMMRIVKAKSLPRWKRIKKELLPFFDTSEGLWRQKRLEKTWAEVQQKISHARKGGKQSASARKSRKALEKRDVVLSAVHDPPPPTMNHDPTSINHEPESKPDRGKNNDSDTGEKTMLPSPRNKTLALDALTPILKDARYFLRHGGYKMSPHMKPQVEQAMQEIEMQVAPIAPDRLRQMVARLMTHFPCPPEKQHRLFADYSDCLKPYPEDLLAAAYQHILKHHKYHTLPKIADWIAFMEPEFQHRKATRRKLEALMAQT